MGTEKRTDIYRTITDRIVAAIEAGTETLRMPWHASGGEAPAQPVNIASGKAYRGINTLALWCAGQAAGYGSGLWGTYRQWQEIGAQVRKGEKASPVVFWKTLDREESEDPGETAAGRRFVARGYSVFNAAQVDGYTLAEAPAPAETARIEHAERFFEGLGLRLLQLRPGPHPDAALFRLSRG
jgi:antirestriction protein ArdC